MLPVEITLSSFLKSAFINPWGFFDRMKALIRLSLGELDGEWENMLFPESESKNRQRLFTWARILLMGHTLIAVVSLALGWWIVPVLITLAPFYGGLMLFLCNNTQHVGLQDYAPDYRLCTRTIILNPVLRFLYWHMNFHIEHHMYAAVPCYNLGKLHDESNTTCRLRAIGLVVAWKEIIAILQRQKTDPAFNMCPNCPRTTWCNCIAMRATGDHHIGRNMAVEPDRLWGAIRHYLIEHVRLQKTHLGRW